MASKSHFDVVIVSCARARSVCAPRFGAQSSERAASLYSFARVSVCARTDMCGMYAHWSVAGAVSLIMEGRLARSRWFGYGFFP